MTTKTEAIAKNLLLNKTCDNCYSQSHRIGSVSDPFFACMSLLRSNGEIPDENTCGRWSLWKFWK